METAPGREGKNPPEGKQYQMRTKAIKGGERLRRVGVRNWFNICKTAQILDRRKQGNSLQKHF